MKLETSLFYFRCVCLIFRCASSFTRAVHGHGSSHETVDDVIRVFEHHVPTIQTKVSVERWPSGPSGRCEFARTWGFDFDEFCMVLYHLTPLYLPAPTWFLRIPMLNSGSHCHPCPSSTPHIHCGSLRLGTCSKGAGQAQGSNIKHPLP